MTCDQAAETIGHSINCNKRVVLAVEYSDVDRNGYEYERQFVCPRPLRLTHVQLRRRTSKASKVSKRNQEPSPPGVPNVSHAAH